MGTARHTHEPAAPRDTALWSKHWTSVLVGGWIAHIPPTANHSPGTQRGRNSHVDTWMTGACFEWRRMALMLVYPSVGPPGMFAEAPLADEQGVCEKRKNDWYICRAS